MRVAEQLRVDRRPDRVGTGVAAALDVLGERGALGVRSRHVRERHDDVDVDDNHVPLQAPPTGVSAGNGRAEEDVDVDGDGDGGRTFRKESEHAVTFQVA